MKTKTLVKRIYTDELIEGTVASIAQALESVENDILEEHCLSRENACVTFQDDGEGKVLVYLEREETEEEKMLRLNTYIYKACVRGKGTFAIVRVNQHESDVENRKYAYTEVVVNGDMRRELFRMYKPYWHDFATFDKAKEFVMDKLLALKEDNVLYWTEKASDLRKKADLSEKTCQDVQTRFDEAIALLSSAKEGKIT